MAASQVFVSHAQAVRSGMTQLTTLLSSNLLASYDSACRGIEACFTHFNDSSACISLYSMYVGHAHSYPLPNSYCALPLCEVLDLYLKCTILFHPHKEPLRYRQHNRENKHVASSRTPGK